MNTVENKKMTAYVFFWDEHLKPEASSDRGWANLVNHPDNLSRYQNPGVGNYLTYDRARGPNGETVHAVAYIFRYRRYDRREERIGLGYAWFHTVAEAKEFIEGNVRAYFGLPREE